MVGTALKKYAESHGMRCDGGYVYGRVNGRYIAMLDGTGVKMLQVYLCPPSQAPEDIAACRIGEVLRTEDPKAYRLIRRGAVNISDGRAVVVFQDGPGAMARISRYIDEVLPRLDALGLHGDACACCGMPMEGEVRHVLADDYVMPVHVGCAAKLSAQPIARGRDQGSVLRGALGALLGAGIGAVLWAIVYMMGYVSGLVGLLIGLLSNFFYGRLGGRKGRARVVIVVAALLIGALLGQIGGVTARFNWSFEEGGGQFTWPMDGEDGFLTVRLTRSQYLKTCWDRYFCRDQTAMLSNEYDRLAAGNPDSGFDRTVTREAFIQRAWDAGYEDNFRAGAREFGANLAMGVFFGLLGCPGLFGQLRDGKRRRTVKMLK